MKHVFRPLVDHNSDALHEELKQEFGEAFHSVNTGPYRKQAEFMFIVGDEFTDEDEKRIDAVLEKHDSKRLTVEQVKSLKAKVAYTWLKEGFNVEAIKEDLRNNDIPAALNKMVQFVEAAADMLSRM